MKLPDFYNFEPLNSIKELMGIPRDVYGALLVEVRIGRLTEAELERLTSPTGIEVGLDDIVILPDGTLAYKNSRVILYIRDVTVYSGREAEPRFHVSNCATLQKMREDGRFNRYVVSTRTDGQFALNLIDQGQVTQGMHDLSVCQNCLSKLSFDGFSSAMNRAIKRNRVKAFRLETFFEQYPRSLHLDEPKYNSDNAPLDVYPTDWTDISNRVRDAARWKCDVCGFDLNRREDRQFLHVHHKNGLKYDCRDANLAAVCVGCHADEPQHAHMKQLDEYGRFLALKARY